MAHGHDSWVWVCLTGMTRVSKDHVLQAWVLGEVHGAKHDTRAWLTDIAHRHGFYLKGMAHLHAELAPHESMTYG